MKKTFSKFGLTMAAVMLVAALAGLWVGTTYRANGARAVLMPDQVMTSFPQPRPLSDFALVDHDGRAFDLARAGGKWTFVFFGYTHCPDICPTTLATLAQLRRQIAGDGAGAGDVQFVFVSVDPDRDQPAQLKQYTTFFDPSFLGVTGSDAELRGLAGQLGVAYEIGAASGDDNYPVSHSAAVFLLDPQARYSAVFTPPFDVKAIGSRFSVLRKLGTGKAA